MHAGQPNRASSALPQTTRDANFLQQLSLKRFSAQGPAGLRVCSLPWPESNPGNHRQLSLDGKASHVEGLGQWIGSDDDAPTPRRALIMADGDGPDVDAPDTLGLTEPGAIEGQPFEHSMELFERCGELGYMWERHALRLRWGGQTLAIAMGLRHAGEVMWWEACRVVTVQESDFCTTVHMSGAIARTHMDAAEIAKFSGYNIPTLHVHNWLTGHLVLRLFHNGVVEVTARHVNSRFFDDGQHLEDVVPIVGFRTAALPQPEHIPGLDGDDERDHLHHPPVDEDAHAALPAEEPDTTDIEGDWDGSRDSLELGGVQLDLSEVSRLALPRYPGSLKREGQFLVFQPYEGVELYGGVCPKDRTGDPYICHPEDHFWPRGMCRTLRFSMSFNPQRSPRIARYLPPAWWYGHNREFSVEPLLPVSNDYDERLNKAVEWSHRGMTDRGFEDGLMPRTTNPQLQEINPDGSPGRERFEIGWEGEIPYGQFLTAYRLQDPAMYAIAMRAAYAYSDIAIEHAASMVRMHGFPPHAFAQPMNRIQAPLAAYLETGDRFLLDAAEAVIETSYRNHQKAWPRLAMGRDAMFIRGAVALYRFTANPHFRRIARECSMAVVQAQRPNGSFGDQGGGSGIHQWGAYITKPWMGLLATGGVLDYLELCPDDPDNGPLRNCIQKFADYLLLARWVRDGHNTWSYQYEFAGEPRHFCLYKRVWQELPSQKPWHQDSIGRVLGYTSQLTGEGKYIDAWADSLSSRLKYEGGDHAMSCVMQFVPWVQDHLWHAQLNDDGQVVVEPMHFGRHTPRDAEIDTPTGHCHLHWADDNRVEAPEGVLTGKLAAAT